MAVKASKSKTTKKTKHSLGEDLKVINLPFMLFTAFTVAVEEINDNDFKYDGIYTEEPSTFIFKSRKRKEYLTINVTKDNLLIKQFSGLKKEAAKLKVIYVVKDSGRQFKLL